MCALKKTRPTINLATHSNPEQPYSYAKQKQVIEVVDLPNDLAQAPWIRESIEYLLILIPRTIVFVCVFQAL